MSLRLEVIRTIKSVSFRRYRQQQRSKVFCQYYLLTISHACLCSCRTGNYHHLSPGQKEYSAFWPQVHFYPNIRAFPVLQSYPKYAASYQGTGLFHSLQWIPKASEMKVLHSLQLAFCASLTLTSLWDLYTPAVPTLPAVTHLHSTVLPHLELPHIQLPSLELALSLTILINASGYLDLGSEEHCLNKTSLSIPITTATGNS